MNNCQRQCVYVVIQLVCYIVHLLNLLDIQCLIFNKSPSNNIEREVVRQKLMTQLTRNEKDCRNIIRMSPYAFTLLCQKLRGTGVLKDYKFSTIEEQVAKFLHILGHNFKNRALGFFFQRSGETVSRHFHNVLQAVITLEGEFLHQPSGAEVPSQIFNNSRFYPYFKVRLIYLHKY